MSWFFSQPRLTWIKGSFPERGNVNGARNEPPAQMVGSVQPTVDAFSWMRYATPRLLSLDEAGAVAVARLETVPVDQVWAVLAFHFLHTDNVSVTHDVALAVQYQVSTAPVGVFVTDEIQLVQQQPIAIRRPLVLPPDSRLQANSRTVRAAGFFRLRATVLELPIGEAIPAFT